MSSAREYSWVDVDTIGTAIGYIWYVYWDGIDSDAVADEDKLDAFRETFKTQMTTGKRNDLDGNYRQVVFGFIDDTPEQILSVPILHDTDAPNNGLLDFFKWLGVSFEGVGRITALLLQQEIAKAIYSDNGRPPHLVNRHALATQVSNYMEKIADTIFLHPLEEDTAELRPDGVEKFFDNRKDARERFFKLCIDGIFELNAGIPDDRPPPPAKASFQDTTLHALGH